MADSAVQIYCAGPVLTPFEPVEPIARIQIYSVIPSKKNLYAKRRGPGKGMYIPRKVQSQLDAIAAQIPVEYRHMYLENPDIEIEFALPEDINKQHTPWMSDPDGRITTMFDIFVKLGILQNDNFRTNNGYKLLHPATLSTEIDLTTFTFYKNGDLMKALKERFSS